MINKQAQAVINRIEKATLNPQLNKKKVEIAFRKHYKLLGVDFPKEVIWRDDLVLGFRAAWGAAWDAARDAAWDAAWGAAWDAAWGAAWDAARGAAVINTGLKDTATRKYIVIETEILKALENGLSWYFPMKDKLILIPLPKFSFDKQNRLHSVKKPAVDWKRGKKFYFIHGVRFNKTLWQQVSNPRIHTKTILTLENMEQRMTTLKVHGVERIIDKAKLLNKSKRGNELYLLKDVFSQDAYYLKYSCPSTSRVYVSGIDPEVGKNKDADECQAWKFSLTTKEYTNLKMET